MPALVKSSVGSLAGTSEEEGTALCPFCSKKRRKMEGTAEPEGLCVDITVAGIVILTLRRGGFTTEIPALRLAARVVERGTLLRYAVPAGLASNFPLYPALPPRLRARLPF